MTPVAWKKTSLSLELDGLVGQIASIATSPAFRRAALILALTAAVEYGRMVGYRFLDSTDDAINFVSNERLDPPTLARLKEIWTSGHFHLYVPVPETVWWGVSFVTKAAGVGWALAPAIRALEFFTHFANALLVYVLAAFLGRRAAPGKTASWAGPELAALGAALVFVTHPVQAQAMGLATGTKQVFGVLPALLGCLAAGAYLEAGGAMSLAVSAVCQAVALFSNPAMVALPFAYLVFGHEATRRLEPGRMWRGFALWGGLSVLAAWIGMSVAQSANLVFVDMREPPPVLAGATGAILVPYVSFWLKPLRAFHDLAFYAGKTIFPYPLVYGYERFFMQERSSAVCWLEITAAFAAVVGAVAACWRSRRREPAAVFGAAWALLTIAPVLGFVTILDQVHSDVADRYLYACLPGVALVAASFLARMPRAWARASIAVLTAIFVVATLCHQGVWASDASLFEDMRLHLPDSWRAHLAVAERHRVAGEDELAYAEFVEAYALYRSCPERTGVYPLETEATMLLPFKEILVRLGKIDELAALYRDAIARNPRDSISLFGMGNILVLEGDVAGGLRDLVEAERIDPLVARREFPPGNVLLLRYPGRFSASALKTARAIAPRFRSIAVMAEIAENAQNTQNIQKPPGRQETSTRH